MTKSKKPLMETLESTVAEAPAAGFVKHPGPTKDYRPEGYTSESAALHVARFLESEYHWNTQVDKLGERWHVLHD